MDIYQFKERFPNLFKVIYRVYFGNLFRRFDQFPQERLKRANMNLFRQHMGYSFDLNNPKTFSEKIQWYAFNWHYEEMVKATDKVLFKEYIEHRLGPGYTIPLIGHWTDIDGFKKAWCGLPEKFVLKSNLSADENNIKIVIDKSKENVEDVVREVKKWLDPKNTQLNCVHCNFYRSIPQILAEEYRTNRDGKLFDYKFFCFDGEPYCVYMSTHGTISFYDLNWQKLDVQYGKYPISTEMFEKPKHFEEMLPIARKLSAEYPFVRVDFYDTDEQLYLGEMTFNPGGGMTKYTPGEMTFNPGGGMTKYTPQTFNLELGNLFNITH